MNTVLPDALRPLTPLIEAHLGAAVQGGARLQGGDISAAYRLRTTRGEFVLKAARPTGGAHLPLYAPEAEGLALLRAAGPLAVPDVIAFGEGPGGWQYLLLSYLPPADDTPALHGALGRGLAALHARPAPGFGGTPDNLFGSLPQQNLAAGSAADFFWHSRLRPQLERAGAALGAADRARFAELRERLPRLIPPEPPSLVHGDLWHGNLLFTVRGPALIDPAAAFSHREVDLAAMRLFGGVPGQVFAAYAGALPPAEGWEDRAALWNLYPLLAHVNMFGAGYLARTREALEAALRLPERWAAEG
ncbi:fructosamine kinase family protein [Deinococcus aquaticus]|uniref:fructosamine kinase family protein n=1 Tax=Deinococcus aquaticus TaxID=328692 RepID=UPI003F4479C2